MHTIPTVLTIAGSDSSGGAGIQGDLKSIAANGGYGASVITAVTAQNTVAVLGVESVSPGMIRAQLDAVFDDLDIRAVKTGMLADRVTIETVAAVLRERRPPVVVCDPVMIAKSGYSLIAGDAVNALARELFPLATLITPNTHEVARLAGFEVTTFDHAVLAGRRLLATGARAVLVKGGHLAASPGTDVLVTAEGVTPYSGEWFDTPHTHGTGCTYASAIATRLAFGDALPEAVRRAKQFMNGAIGSAFAVGRGHGPTDPFFKWRGEAGGKVSAARSRNFMNGRLMVITDETLGGPFSHVELARLAALGGADWVQLREKRAVPAADLVRIARDAAQAVDEAGCGGTRVIIDDRADVAVAAGIDALHLGRHDLDPRDARRILGDGAIIGGTANNLDEARSAACGPIDYLGVGPVFETRSKANPAPVLGLDGLAGIVRGVNLPVFAIGGITAERARDVLATGAQGVAVLSAVTASRDPAAATREFRERMEA